MKKLAIILLLIPFLLTSCQAKKQKPEEPVAVEETAVPNENSYVPSKESDEKQTSDEDLSGKVISLSAEEFVVKITEIDDPRGFRYKGHTPCLVDFYADWCRPCISIKPLMEKMAKKYKGKLIIYKVNVDHAQEVCSAFDIQNIPTIMFFNITDQPSKMVGAPSESELENAIQDFLK